MNKNIFNNVQVFEPKAYEDYRGELWTTYKKDEFPIPLDFNQIGEGFDGIGDWGEGECNVGNTQGSIALRKSHGVGFETTMVEDIYEGVLSRNWIDNVQTCF